MEKTVKELVPIDYESINDGAMIEGFGIELQKCLANIADLNTPATAVRQVELKLTLKPHSDRTVIETEFTCKSKLAPIQKHVSKMFLGGRRAEIRLPLAWIRTDGAVHACRSEGCGADRIPSGRSVASARCNGDSVRVVAVRERKRTNLWRIEDAERCDRIPGQTANPEESGDPSGTRHGV